MEQILKKIKKEIKPIQKANNLKYSHTNNRYQETLGYTAFFSLNRKKHYLEFRFVYQKQEESLSFLYNYAFNTKTTVVNEAHSLANYPEDKLPGIKEDSKLNCNDLYKFEVVDGQIKNTVDIDVQYEGILTIFRQNFQIIMKYAKNIAKIKKIPE